MYVKIEFVMTKDRALSRTIIKLSIEYFRYNSILSSHIINLTTKVYFDVSFAALQNLLS